MAFSKEKFSPFPLCSAAHCLSAFSRASRSRWICRRSSSKQTKNNFVVEALLIKGFRVVFFHKEKPTWGKHPHLLTWKNSTAVWQRKGRVGREKEGRKKGRKEVGRRKYQITYRMMTITQRSLLGCSNFGEYFYLNTEIVVVMYSRSREHVWNNNWTSRRHVCFYLAS